MENLRQLELFYRTNSLWNQPQCGGQIALLLIDINTKPTLVFKLIPKVSLLIHNQIIFLFLFKEWKNQRLRIFLFQIFGVLNWHQRPVNPNHWRATNDDVHIRTITIDNQLENVKNCHTSSFFAMLNFCNS